jgi:hypothetical protein
MATKIIIYEYAASYINHSKKTKNNISEILLVDPLLILIFNIKLIYKSIIYPCKMTTNFYFCEVVFLVPDNEHKEEKQRQDFWYDF